MSNKPSFLVAAIAGGVAGASETIITYPAEFIKTRRQLPTHTGGRVTSWSILRSVLRSQGLAGVYSGSPALIASNTAKGGIRFFSFETGKRILERVLGPNTASVHVLAGLCAGVAESILVVTPAEVIKTQAIHMSIAGLKRRSTLSIAGQVVRTDGLFGLWRGLGPVLCKQGTNSAVRFASFGMIKERVSKAVPSLGNTSSTLLAGALSGVVTTYASMPFDNIKTRMQSVDNKYKNMLECGRHMLHQEGVKVFWRATTPRLVRLTLSSGITFTVFDQIVALVAWINRGRGQGKPLTVL
ncbi:hypothetical protein PV11_04513 [Exophiala sideris]|uniref:Mitochondrial thiamine pyrophosphate carrier 1 n=1 Tax=Exophiala sideris TaxID=1016849 RepID=A0A0D1X447_9EURO|nr:hypothetical protein PV11_04513 [Exophiala sideris]